MDRQVNNNSPKLLRNILTILVSVLLLVAVYYLLYASPVQDPKAQVEEHMPQEEDNYVSSPKGKLLEQFMVWP